MTGIIILAAGSSSRLGQAKQQLLFQGKTLLQHSIQAALASEGSPVIVVLGANAEEILPEVESASLQVVLNPGWEEGMASSIRVGLTKLLELSPEISSALFMLCDQPFVSSDLLSQLIRLQKKSGKKIVACSYQNTLGAPVLFHLDFFSMLLQLQGQEGAKKLLAKYPDESATVPFQEGGIDIDTREDYEALQNQKQTGNTLT